MPNNYPLMEWTEGRVSRFWDWQSQFPENYFTYQFGATIVASLKQYLRGRSRVLDYGCGVGYLLPHLCREVREVYGADPSEQSVLRVKEKFAALPNFKGAFLIKDLHQRHETFDAVVCVEVVEHLSDNVLDGVLADVRGLLAADGYAIFTTPNNEDLSKNMVFCPSTGELFHRWQHVRSWDRDSLPARLRASGFEIVEVVETNMSVSTSNSPKNLVKRAVKRILFGTPGTPHLVCVARRAAAQG